MTCLGQMKTGYVFTGNMVTEKTNASTMQLLNAGTKEWEIELLEKIGVSKELFPPLTEPGTILGDLQKNNFQNMICQM